LRDREKMRERADLERQRRRREKAAGEERKRKMRKKNKQPIHQFRAETNNKRKKDV
jgi:hypothetical protein